MKDWLAQLRKGYGKKLARLHTWNGWIVVILAVTGLLLISGFWRGVLGEGRVWIKWAHIVVGILSIVPVLYYLALAGKHWKQLRQKPWQRFNVLVVLGLLLGWFVSGVLLWQFRAVGPAVSNVALVVHDLLTWVGLPYIIYHSLTRVKWLKEPARRTVREEQEALPADLQGVSPRSAAQGTSQGADTVAAAQPGTAAQAASHNVSPAVQPGASAQAAVQASRSAKREVLHPAAQPQPLYTRRSFIRGAIGAGLAVTLGPSFLRWVGSIVNVDNTEVMQRFLENDANRMVPPPQPLPASTLPLGGGAQGRFRVYTVTAIPSFTNANWSFTVDGLVDQPLSWNWEAFLQLQREVQVSDFHCVTGWSVYNNTWEGIPIARFLEMAGVRPEATAVKLYSGDGVYTSGLRLEQLTQDEVLVAVMHDGKPIPSDLGGPVRLIVPKMYAYKSVKWLNRIELVEQEHIGYWEQRGYANDAWV